MRWAIAAPLVAVFGLGVLYGIGAALRGAQFHAAGLSSADLLPLVPFWHLVATGAEAMVAAAVMVPVVVGAAWMLRQLVTETERKSRIDDVVDRLLADHELLRAQVEKRGPAVAAPEHFDRRLRRLDGRAEKTKAVIARRRFVAGVAAVVAVFVLAFVLSPAALLAAAFSVWFVNRYEWHTLRTTGVVFSALLLAVLVERFEVPPPVPEASVRSTQGHLLAGHLIAATPRAWYIDAGDGRVRTIPTVRIARSSVRPTRNDGPRSIGGRVTDFLH